MSLPPVLAYQVFLALRQDENPRRSIMFPPMSPLSERVRAENENREIEREAALQAQYGDQSRRPGLHLMVTTLKSRLPAFRRPRKVETAAPSFADPCAQPEPGC